MILALIASLLHVCLQPDRAGAPSVFALRADARWRPKSFACSREREIQHSALRRTSRSPASIRLCTALLTLFCILHPLGGAIFLFFLLVVHVAHEVVNWLLPKKVAGIAEQADSVWQRLTLLLLFIALFIFYIVISIWSPYDKHSWTRYLLLWRWQAGTPYSFVAWVAFAAAAISCAMFLWSHISLGV